MKLTPWVIGLLFAAVTLAVYAPVGGHDFVRFDDREYVVHNRHVNTGLTADNVRWAFTEHHAANWHPLTWVSHMADCQLFGLRADRHKLVNATLHALNVMLLFLVLRAMTGSTLPSAVVAGLFGLHPVHVESVAWVAQRKDVLAGMFAMLTLAAYTGYVKRGSYLHYAATCLCLTLGLLCKATLVTLPCLLLLLDIWPLERRVGWGRRIVEKLPLLAISIAASVVTFVVQRVDGAVRDLATVGVADRLANAVVSYVRYLGQVIWPRDLAVLYPHPAMLGDGASWPLAAVAAAATALGAVTLVIWCIVYRTPGGQTRKYLLVGWLWFLGMLVPMIGLVHVGRAAMADRYLYLPAIGLYLAGVWAARDVLRHAVSLDPYRRAALATLAACAVIGALLLRTPTQVQVWRDSETLFAHAVRVTEDNWVAHVNLANELSAQQRYDEAIAHYQAAIAVQPNVVQAHDGLGITLARSGRTTEAITALRRAVQVDDRFVQSHYNLGVLLKQRGDHAQAAACFERAIDLKPDFMAAKINLASMSHAAVQVE